MGWRVGLVGAAVWLLPAVAAAQWPAPAKPWQPEEPPTTLTSARQRFWYGQPILLADGLSYSLMLLASEYDEVEAQTLPLAFANYLLTPSLIHLGVGNWAQALADVPLRLGAPFGGALVGATLDCGDGDDECGDGVLGGAIAGMLIATVIDVAFFAYEKPARSRASLTPSLSLQRGHAVLGASGAF